MYFGGSWDLKGQNLMESHCCSNCLSPLGNHSHRGCSSCEYCFAIADLFWSLFCTVSPRTIFKKWSYCRMLGYCFILHCTPVVIHPSTSTRWRMMFGLPAVSSYIFSCWWRWQRVRWAESIQTFCTEVLSMVLKLGSTNRGCGAGCCPDARCWILKDTSRSAVSKELLRRFKIVASM